jgi:endo-1,4-beta-xylanase
MGLKIFVTEMDINDDTWKTGDPAEIDAAVAQTYHDYMDVIVSEPAVAAVLTWGVTDAHTWLAGRRPGPRPPGAGSRPGQPPSQMAGQAAGQAEVLPPGPPPGQTAQPNRPPERPLLFDANNKPKAAFFTVRDAFDIRTA